jgi:hypothetical protein
MAVKGQGSGSDQRNHLKKLSKHLQKRPNLGLEDQFLGQNEGCNQQAVPEASMRHHFLCCEFVDT